jgi:DNA-binding response OmpR family regulator
MRILLADHDPVSSRLLEQTLAAHGHEILLARDGLTAWDLLVNADPALLAILDWTMPGLDGPDICQRVQSRECRPRPYLILLTAHRGKEDLIAGLASGADDYITKPFDTDELLARVNVGLRVLELQAGLGQRIRDLEAALTQIKQLQGLLPICMYCKKIRVDPNYWQQVEAYLAQHIDARFSHGICPDCYEGVVKPEVNRAQKRHAECQG